MTRFFLTTIFCVTTALSFGQSQGDMNADAHAKYQKADKALNAVYQKILVEYKEDTTFIKNFKAAQRLWVQLRDAEMKAKYPEDGDYGSVQPMCWSMYLTELTEERTNKLRVWLTGEEEGDVCRGSVKSNGN